jgi:hypothetical protein
MWCSTTARRIAAFRSSNIPSNLLAIKVTERQGDSEGPGSGRLLAAGPAPELNLTKLVVIYATKLPETTETQEEKCPTG